MKNRTWIFAELNNQHGYFASYSGVQTILKPTMLFTDKSLAVQIAQAFVGNVRFDTAIPRYVVADLGLWFHAGWHDQASLEVFECIKGSSQLAERMFRNLEVLQPEQNGDMVLGFAALERDWALLVDVSRERRTFSAEIRAASTSLAAMVCGRIIGDLNEVREPSSTSILNRASNTAAP